MMSSSTTGNVTGLGHETASAADPNREPAGMRKARERALIRASRHQRRTSFPGNEEPAADRGERAKGRRA